MPAFLVEDYEPGRDQLVPPRLPWDSATSGGASTLPRDSGLPLLLQTVAGNERCNIWGAPQDFNVYTAEIDRLSVDLAKTQERLQSLRKRHESSDPLYGSSILSPSPSALSGGEDSSSDLSQETIAMPNLGAISRTPLLPRAGQDNNMRSHNKSAFQRIICPPSSSPPPPN